MGLLGISSCGLELCATCTKLKHDMEAISKDDHPCVEPKKDVRKKLGESRDEP